MVDQEKPKLQLDGRTENVILYVTTAALVLGLFALSGSWHSLWGLVMLFCVNTKTR